MRTARKRPSFHRWCDVYQDKPDAAWLKSAVAVLKKDYNFWMTKRLAPCGLNRSGNDADEQ